MLSLPASLSSSSSSSLVVEAFSTLAKLLLRCRWRFPRRCRRRCCGRSVLKVGLSSESFMLFAGLAIMELEDQGTFTVGTSTRGVASSWLGLAIAVAKPESCCDTASTSFSSLLATICGCCFCCCTCCCCCSCC